MIINGKHVKLRAIEQSDFCLIQKWSNDAEVTEMLGGWHFPSSAQDQFKWYQQLHLNSLHQRFAIEVPETGLIGVANLTDINWKDRNAFHGMLIGEKKIQGKGYGMDTVMTLMKLVFEEMNFERLDTTIIEYNERSIHVYTKKCGWQIEGRKRNYYFRKNRYWDVIILGITKLEYFELLETNNYWNTD